MKPYVIFHRTWWKHNSSWPGGREPGVGPATLIGRANTEEEAIEMCKTWNESHTPGQLSRKAEFTIGDIQHLLADDDDFEPTDHEMMSSFGTKWHDYL